jgi:hypothetical protein
MPKALAVRSVSLAVALAALAVGGYLAAHHPLSPLLALVGCAAAAALCFGLQGAWLFLLPALLPIVDLAPWTGWLTFEEFDILVLGAAAGAHLRHAWQGPSNGVGRRSLLVAGLWSLFAVSIAVALLRGVLDAGGAEFGWFQGYHGPMNSLRLAKGFLLALLFAPLMRQAVAGRPEESVRLFAWGMAAGLAMASLAAVWERAAFAGLLNFSSDYRTTALFWEMHVGGAALDGFLLLTLPFALWLMVRGHGLRGLLLPGLVLGLGAYACLTTFSRGVYLADLVALGLMALLMLPSSPRPGAAVTRISLFVRGSVFMVLALALALLVFRHGGYRSLAAVLGVFGMVVTTGPLVRGASVRRRVMSAVVGIALGILAGLCWAVFDKGAYWAFGGLALLAVSATFAARRGAGVVLRTLALAASLALLPAAALVAWHWGGSEAFAETLAALVLIAAVAAWNALGARSLWPAELRSQTLLVGGVALSAAIAAIFSGGAYMGERFASSEQDLEGRLAHWRDGLGLLKPGADWWLGKGLGRFPAAHFFGTSANEMPGDYRLAEENGKHYLVISGPRYQSGYGEVLRISQRVSLEPLESYKVEMDVRVSREAQVEIAICEKHLLYRDSCADKLIQLAPAAGGWQHQVIQLPPHQFGIGAWYAPRMAFFSVAMESLGGVAEVDNLSLTGTGERQLLKNGDFESDMARWFITSDHHHLPWHIKNLFLHVLFEQGLLGLLIFCGMVTVVLFRLLIGPGAAHPLAPPAVASILGFLVVGLFDSLLDVPRLAFLFYLTLLFAAQLARSDSGHGREAERAVRQPRKIAA